MKRILNFLLLMSVVAALSAATKVRKATAVDKPKADAAYLFFYSPDAKSGFHVASSPDTVGFKEMGQLFSSDYSQWGAEKRMYAPFIYKLAEGGYAAVFQVNDYAPCFAVAYSEDLVTWRPQDYPKMSVKGCLEPVIATDGNAYKIIFKTKDGQYRKTTVDPLMRRFTADCTATAAEYAAACVPCDTAMVNGKLMTGFRWKAERSEIERLEAYFKKWAEAGKRWSETLKDDARFGTEPYAASLFVDFNNTKAISDKLIGVFFEDISYAADGGLYAELVQNRDFEYNARDRREWNAFTAWRSTSGKADVRTDRPLSTNNPHYLIVKADTLYNSGWDGIVVRKGAKYDFSFFVRNTKKAKRFKVALVAGGKVLAAVKIKTQGREGEWKKYETVLVATADADKAELMLIGESSSEAAIDMVSLFPQDTYKGRKNGLRKDLAQAIADLQPKFVRFPGGCMSHGNGLDNIYHWNHTVGPLHERVYDSNIWHYHQTRGLGFYEYFQFCEDIGAEPLPVLAAGVPCQNSGADADGFGGQQGGIPMEDMPAYIDELCNLIEWANGNPVTNEWAKMRADAGHPEPFNLKYIGIGNEDIISTVFEERCLMICKEIKRRYPDIIVCGTVGPFHAPSSDYVEGWRFANANRQYIDMVDEHYYESVGWFLNNHDYYDNYDRTGPKVYLGEYAARMGKGGLDCALAEAVYLCNIERNADVVAMTSYAPLLSKNGHSNWSPDMMYFSNTAIEKTPSYETQRLFSVYSGDSYIASQLTVSDSLITNRVAASVVRDSKTGNTYLKVANVLPVSLRLTLEGVAAQTQMSYEGFEGQPGQRSVTPHTGIYSGPAIELPPYSFRVIKL